VAPGDTAWGYRDAVWSGVAAGIDPEPANAGTIRQWCMDYWEELHPHSMGGGYVNFTGTGESQDRSGPRTTIRTTAFAGPVDFNAAPPPSRQARRRRSTDRSLSCKRPRE
jgi:hypothetical protein